MGAKNLEGRSSPTITYSTTVVIEFTATLGVMVVRKELVVAPKTLFGIHSVFGEKRVSAVCYMDRWNLVPSFFDDVMDGDTPIPPLTS